jgi:hypothetical protein
MEATVGRRLSAIEEVHHINMRKLENGIENLALLPDGSTHHRLHKYLERIAVYLLGLTEIRPEPLDFGQPVFWGGKYVTVLDLLASCSMVEPTAHSRAFESPGGPRAAKEVIQ